MKFVELYKEHGGKYDSVNQCSASLVNIRTKNAVIYLRGGNTNLSLTNF